MQIALKSFELWAHFLLCPIRVYFPYVLTKCRHKSSRAVKELPILSLNPEDAASAILGGNLKLPVLVKPRCGQGSVAMERVWDETHWKAIHRLFLKRLEAMSSNQLQAYAEPDSFIFQETIGMGSRKTA